MSTENQKYPYILTKSTEELKILNLVYLQIISSSVYGKPSIFRCFVPTQTKSNIWGGLQISRRIYKLSFSPNRPDRRMWPGNFENSQKYS